ncbi:MAG: phosphopyruvate hydratase [bacterium]|nr:phosphopyruvate hydratase [bacterium]
MILEDIKIHEIFDSRGESTLEVEVLDEKLNSFSAQIPSGKSRGKGEAAVLSFKEAEKVLNELVKKELFNKNFNSIKDLDDFLIGLDGTANKEKLGGNLMLGISVAFARALARKENKELWQVLNEEFWGGLIIKKKPLIFSNLINGGAHAGNNLDIQEYMVVVDSKDQDYVASIKTLIGFYKKLGELLKTKYKLEKIIIGDEGGYAINFESNFEPIKIMEELLAAEESKKSFSLALDVAASNFYKEGKYTFGGNEISSEKLNQVLLDYLAHSNLLMSVEDPFDEEDFNGFKEFNAKCPDKWVVGDDLTVTNPELIEKFSKEKMISGVIIKPNQIGTVSEACQAIRVAQENGLKTIVSHRSGETEDTFIIHLAKAGNVDAVKIGAPARERLVKFDELIRLYN